MSVSVARCARTAALLSLGACAARTSPAPRFPVGHDVGVSAPPTLSSALEERVRRVEQVLRERGATVLRERWTAFLARGATEGFSLAVDRPQCLAVVGVGPEGVSDLDLFVLDAQGSELARDDRADAHPYARVCPRQAGAIRVFARATAGVGEVAVLLVAAPPMVAPPLDVALGGVPTGMVTGPRIPRGTIGADPHRPTAEVLVERLLRPYTERRWSPVGVPGRGELHRQQLDRWTFPAQEGHCYLLQGAGGEGVDDLDLVVHGPDGDVVAQDVALDATPAVRFCAAQGGAHAVEVRMYAGSGAWALRALELPVPRRIDDLRDVDASTRARHRELTLDAEARGLAPLGEAIRGAPWSSLAQSMRIRAEAGRCYLFGAVADGAVSALDLWVSDAHGAVLSSDTGERERATVFHCARDGAEVMVHVRTATARGAWVLQAFGAEDAS